MAQPRPIDPRRRWLLRLARLRLWLFVALAAALIGSTWVLQSGEWAPWARLLIALVPAAPMAAIIATYTILVRNACFDEFGRRVLLEGCATVFIVGMPLLLLYGMVRNAEVGLGGLDWRGVFLAAAVLWGLGVTFSLRRHQGYVNWTSRGRPEAGGGGVSGGGA